MCTVTYLPKNNGNGFFLTSNRDEFVKRHAPSPAKIIYNGNTVYFPKEPIAGGTWIGLNENGRICCLLNGAFENHQRNKNYNKSRGYVLLDLLTSPLKPDFFFDIEDLSTIEPFTILTFDNRKGNLTYFSQFVWDGKSKHLRFPDPNVPHIWSSSTLYNTEAKRIRETWFEQFIEDTTSFTRNSVLGFHKSQKSEDKKINILMEREENFRTVSITQVETIADRIEMNYHDMLNEKITSLCIGETRDMMVS